MFSPEAVLLPFVTLLPICNWISLFTRQIRNHPTLIISGYPVDSDSLLLWFRPNQHVATLFVLFWVKTGKKHQLLLYCNTLHTNNVFPLVASSTMKRWKDWWGVGGDWWLYPLWFWDSSVTDLTYTRCVRCVYVYVYIYQRKTGCHNHVLTDRSGITLALKYCIPSQCQVLNLCGASPTPVVIWSNHPLHAVIITPLSLEVRYDNEAGNDTQHLNVHVSRTFRRRSGNKKNWWFWLGLTHQNLSRDTITPVSHLCRTVEKTEDELIMIICRTLYKMGV